MTGSTSPEQHDLIEAYLRGTLNEEQVDQFELALFEDPEFASEVQLHQSLKRSMKAVPKSAWSADTNNPQQPNWLEALWNNSGLAWLLAGGCAAALVVGIARPIPSHDEIVIASSVSIHSYRGNNQAATEILLSDTSPGKYLLLTVDTPHVNHLARLSLHRPGKTESLVGASGLTDDVGTLSVVLPTAGIPPGAMNLQVSYDDGSQDQWQVEIR